MQPTATPEKPMPATVSNTGPGTEGPEQDQVQLRERAASPGSTHRPEARETTFGHRIPIKTP